MPNGNLGGVTTQRVRHGEPQPVPDPAALSDNDTTQREPTKKDLASWWRGFKRGNQRRDDDNREHLIPLIDLRADVGLSNKQMKSRPALCKVLCRTAKKVVIFAKKLIDPPEQKGIFGVPLQTSIRYANVAISLYDSEGKSYIYGYVPIVVAKCGIFLKEKGTKSDPQLFVVESVY